MEGKTIMWRTPYLEGSQRKSSCGQHLLTTSRLLLVLILIFVMLTPSCSWSGDYYIAGQIAGPPPAQYDIGEIPPQTAWYGRRLDFTIRSQQLGSDAELSMQPLPQPAGNISFVPSTGLFSYMPAPTDTGEFKVT